MVRTACIFVCLLLAPATRPAAPATEPDYFALSSEDFWELAAVDKPLDFLAPNHRLISAAIFHETNRQRARQNLPPFQHLNELDEAARLHVRYMMENRYVGHEEKNGKFPTPFDRVRAVGLRGSAVGENVALAFGIQYKGGAMVTPLEGGGL